MPTPGPIFSPDTILRGTSGIIKNENTLNKLPDLNHSFEYKYELSYTHPEK